MAQQVIGKIRPTLDGTYNSSKDYEPLDRVLYNNVLYECIQTSKGNLPTNDTYWVRLTGNTPTFSVGTVSAGSTARASLTQENTNYSLNLTLPSPSARVEKANDTATITITDYSGTTTTNVKDGTTPVLKFNPVVTLDSDKDASLNVSQSGSTYNLTLSIPRGKNGTDGTDGATPVLQFDANTLSSESKATVSTQKNGNTYVITLGIPQGIKGDAGNSYEVSDAINSSSSTTVASSKAVKTVYDKSVIKVAISGNTLTYTKGDNSVEEVTVDGLSYDLPVATASVLGGIKAGDNVTISASGALSVTKQNVLNALNDYATHLYAGTATGNTNAVTTNGNTNLILLDDTTVRDRIALKGSGGTTVVSDAQGTVTINSIAYSEATGTSSGLFSASDKVKLDSIAAEANKYTLPNATSTELGGVKVGSNLTVSSGTLSLTKQNVTSALGYTPPEENTNSVTHLYAGTSTGTVNAATTNGNTYLLLLDDTTVRDKRLIKGTGGTTVTSDASGNITINSTTYSNATSSSSGLLSSTDKSKLDSAMLSTGGTFTGSVGSSYVTLTGSDIDLSKGNFFYKELTEATTFTISNLPAAGIVKQITLIVVNGDKGVTWPSEVKWANNVQPTLTSGPDVFTFTILGD